MRVLQINAVYGFASTGQMVKEMHEYLCQNNIESYVACAQGCDNSMSNEYVIGNAIDVKIHSLMGRVTGLQGYYSTNATRNLIDYMERIKPNIVHLGNLHSNYVNVPMLLQYLGVKNIATVVTLHDCWFFTGKCSHYTMDGCYKWQESCGNCPRLKKDIPSWFFDCTTKMLKDKQKCYQGIKNMAVVGVSKWIIEEARKSILKDAVISKYIYNWIDRSVFCYREKEALDYRIKLGLVGKVIMLGVSIYWAESKGLSTFIALSKFLKDDEIIVLVGEKPEVDLPTNIICVPPTKKPEELAIYYSMADVFLQLSPEESFGKVVAESMSCGTPVITIDSTANSELVREGTGFVCEVGCTDKIYDKVLEIKKMGRNSFSDQCRKMSEQEFNMECQLSKYVDVYRDLISIQQH